MKAKELLELLNKLNPIELEKEITFYDYKNNIAHETPPMPFVVDLSDDEYLDLVFNYPNVSE
jgi:hypothetical protein